MIGSLRGTLLQLDGLCALIEAGGVGYEVEIPASLALALKSQQQVFVYVHHVVREDASLLFGFGSITERTLFRELIKVSGIGPKGAMAVLSCLNPQDFAAAVTAGDSKTLISVPGIGKRTAERLIIEMRDRLPKLNLRAAAVPETKPDVDKDRIIEEASAALQSLGYKEAMASKVAAAVYQPESGVEEVIVQALKFISAGGRV